MTEKKEEREELENLIAKKNNLLQDFKVKNNKFY